MTPANLRTQSVSDLDLSNIDSILHCAALVHQMNGAPEEKYFKVNYELTKSLAEKAKLAGIKHFIFISTAHVYGQYGNLKNHDQVLGKDTPCQPTDPYGKSKLAAEDFLRTLQSADFQVSILRPPMVYGEGAKGNLISLNKLIKTMPLLPFKYPDNRRSLIYVGNLVQFIHLVVQHQKSGLYLPQDKASISIQELVKLIAKANNSHVFLFRLPNFIFDLLCYLKPDIMKRLFGSLALESDTTSDLGYTPTYDTEFGLRAMFSDKPKYI